MTKKRKKMKNLDIYNELRKMHYILTDIELDPKTDDFNWKENALMSVSGVLYLAEKLFCREEGT